MLFRSLRHNLTRLVRFGGRDTRHLFWPYAGVVFGLTMAAYMLAFAVLVMLPVFSQVVAYAKNHPEHSRIESGPMGVNITIDGPIDPVFATAIFAHVITTMVILVVSMVALLAVLLGAAITRRLHDNGWSGTIALIPVALLIAFMAQMQRFAPPGPDLPGDPLAFLGLMATDLGYLASLGGLIWLLVRKGSPQANRYGKEPCP